MLGRFIMYFEVVDMWLLLFYFKVVFDVCVYLFFVLWDMEMSFLFKKVIIIFLIILLVLNLFDIDCLVIVELIYYKDI